jgi:VanZ family protein
LLVVLSVVPLAIRPTSPAPHNLEHFASFAVAGALQYTSYPARPVRWFLVALLFCGGLELLQIGIPGRHARVEDFVIDTVAACLGILGAYVIIGIKRSH